MFDLSQPIIINPLALPVRQQQIKCTALWLALCAVFLQAGCSSTPSKNSNEQHGGKKSSAALNAMAKKNEARPTEKPRPLDLSSIDELESLLEATDMAPVENDRLAIMRYGDVWERLRNGMKLDLQDGNERIGAQIGWFASRQPYIDRVSARASRYLYYTVSEAEKRKIPTEIALLPVIESSYDPTATSNAAAAGMWQFIPSTAKLYGLEQNYYYDGRRDVVASTRAAYDFLTSLYERFGSWELALAAYNAGPGRVQQAINRNLEQGLPTDYWSLRLPTETMNYVPRLFAVAQIVKHPDNYGVSLPKIANRPHFRQVDLPGVMDLTAIAQTAGMSQQEFFQLNPGFKRGQTNAVGPVRVLIPNDLSASIDKQLKKLPMLSNDMSGYLALNRPIEPVGVEKKLEPTELSNEQAARMLGPSTPAVMTITPVPAAKPVVTAAAPAVIVLPPVNPLPRNADDLATLASKAVVPAQTNVQTNVQGTVNAAVTNDTSLPRALAAIKTKDEPVPTVQSSPPQPLIVPVTMDDPFAKHKELSSIETQQSVLQQKGESLKISFDKPATKMSKADKTQNDKKRGQRTIYQIKAGDNLSSIATAFAVDVSELAKWNQMDVKAPLWVGSTLYLYGLKAKPAKEVAKESATDDKSKEDKSKEAKDKTSKQVSKVKKGTYRIKAGDTLKTIANRAGISTSALAAFNDIPMDSTLQVGDDVFIPAFAKSMPTAKEDKPAAKVKTKAYTIKKGETLRSVAEKNDLSLAELADLNDIPATTKIHTGDTIFIPK